ncbi:hypothetical protein I6N91_14295 [Arthrobacter sp. MSA 4-2]|uniref:hypothetical protein n=1 Tax=Arthrobacter sp. MSA 4-2 TaxID=2794349 RepID=UPI0018E8B8A6|nr:hypothetical protein [Arthrobacter sp. MSA 4-2]MBJ2122150.1 hypothetical protein [Arthrobacter sp. MSA 4-2]
MHPSRPHDAGSYPPPVYAPAPNRTAAPPVGLLWWAGSTAVLGIVLGVFWWLGAPGGILFGDGRLPGTWLLRDLTLAGLELVAGVAVGTVLARRLGRPGGLRRLLAAVGGSILGSLLAVLVGTALGAWIGPHGSPEIPGSGFGLHSPGAAAIWPAAAALIVFAAALFDWLQRGRP